MMDHYGRVVTIKIAVANILITGIATPFVNGFFIFAVLRFLMGLSYPTFFMCTFMLSKFYFSTFKMCLSLFIVTVVCKKVHKIRSVWCKMALGEVGVSLP